MWTIIVVLVIAFSLTRIVWHIRKGIKENPCFLGNHCWHDIVEHRAKRLSKERQVECRENPFPYVIREPGFSDTELTYWQQQKCCKCGKTKNKIEDQSVYDHDGSRAWYEKLPDKIFW